MTRPFLRCERSPRRTALNRPVFAIHSPTSASGQDTVTTGAHIAFRADSREAVHEFHSAALANGGRDIGAPGPRAVYSPGYYGAFVLDPDGNNIEAVARTVALILRMSP